MADTAADQKCQYCGGLHTTKCPLVAAIEFYPDGSTKRVEFIKAEPIVGAFPVYPPTFTGGGRP